MGRHNEDHLCINLSYAHENFKINCHVDIPEDNDPHPFMFDVWLIIEAALKEQGLILYKDSS